MLAGENLENFFALTDFSTGQSSDSRLGFMLARMTPVFFGSHSWEIQI